MDTPPNAYALLMPNAPRKRQVKTIYDGEVEPLELEEDETIIISDDETIISDDETITISDDETEKSAVQYGDCEILRGAFLSVSAKDIVNENDINILRGWQELFSPNSQPRNEEEFDYVNVMFRLVVKRIADLE